MTAVEQLAFVPELVDPVTPPALAAQRVRELREKLAATVVNMAPIRSTPPPPAQVNMADELAKIPAFDFEWWQVKDSYPSRKTANQIAYRHRHSALGDAWEFRTGPIGDGTYGLWARRKQEEG